MTWITPNSNLISNARVQALLTVFRDRHGLMDWNAIPPRFRDFVERLVTEGVLMYKPRASGNGWYCFPADMWQYDAVWAAKYRASLRKPSPAQIEVFAVVLVYCERNHRAHTLFFDNLPDAVSTAHRFTPGTVHSWLIKPMGANAAALIRSAA